MPCQLNNHSNTDLSSLEPHVQGMYDYFDQKLGFNKAPTMHFDSDPSNQSNVLGKTAYYDPSSLEIHIFTDGRHPKDMLRSIAHELIHHQQNLEGRLNVGGYMGQGYYLKNEAMRELEQEAMLEGNALMREYEDTLKLEEKNEMSLKEWKNNELNKNLMRKFGLLKEAKGKYDDGDGKDEKCDHVPCKDEEVIKEADCPKCEGECKCEEMNEEVAELQEMDRREQYRADFERMMPDATPEEIDRALDDYMAPPISKPKKRGSKFGEPGYGEFPAEPEEYTLKQGFKDVLGQAFSLEETLKRIAKAKNITLRSSGKKIK